MERFQDYSSKTKPKVSNSQDSDFLIFGYTCKLYRDDQRADWINNGHHLIKWIGDHDEKLLIDRFVLFPLLLLFFLFGLSESHFQS